jgi:hypothetical protein
LTALGSELPVWSITVADPQGRLLADLLAPLCPEDNLLILALPRGGVPGFPRPAVKAPPAAPARVVPQPE